MKPNELEILIANCLRDNNLDISEFVSFPVVASFESLTSKPAGYFTQVEDTGHYYLSDGSKWIDLGTTQDESIIEIDTEIDQIQEDIKRLKATAGDSTVLSEYVKKSDFNSLAEENVVPLTDDEIDNILQGGA